MGRGKDKYWEYIEALEDGRLLCTFCRTSYAAGITRMRYHFAGLKRHDIGPCPKVPESVRNAVSQEIQASDSSRKTKIVSSPKKKSKTFHQPKVAGACKTDKSKANTSLVRFLVSNKLSLDVSRTPYLGDLLSSVAEVGHGYKLPTYSELQSQQILDAKEEIEGYIGKTKKLFTKTGCTLIISKVEINSKPECLNFFVCSPGGWICLEKVRIPEEGMTFHSFKNNVCHIIEDLGPKNVVQVILDDSKNCMVRCFTDIRGDNLFSEVIKVIQWKYAWIYLSRCATRELVEILLYICSEVRCIRETIQLAKRIFKYMCKCNSTLQLLRKQLHPGNKEYSCSEKNKIAIEFFILNSILQIEKELQALGIQMAPASFEGEGLSSENDAAMVVQKAISSTEFWSNGKKVVRVLQPLFQVLELIDGYESTSGYLNEALKRVEEVLKQHLDGKDRIEVLRAWRSRLVQPMHEVASFLNPAYACGLNFCHANEIKMVLDSLMLLVSDTEREDLLKEVQLYRRKDSDLFNEEAMTMLKTLHPWKWWDCYGDHYPILQKIAVRLLSQTCSTSLCDHITFRQNPSVNESTMNKTMMEKFNAFKSKNLKPIDLQRISGLPEYSHEHVQKFLEDLDVSDNNINDEVDTPEYRNLNCQLNCGLGPESTVRELNLEPQQHGHENLEIESPSECNLGQIFCLSPPPSLEFVLEPGQRGHVKNFEYRPVRTLPECNAEAEQCDSQILEVAY
ncbi:hypothetical protein AB3S75_031058 [Citrus x aurantiifolia]